jgi:hypothetical protein
LSHFIKYDLRRKNTGEIFSMKSCARLLTVLAILLFGFVSQHETEAKNQSNFEGLPSDRFVRANGAETDKKSNTKYLFPNV